MMIMMIMVIILMVAVMTAHIDDDDDDGNDGTYGDGDYDDGDDCVDDDDDDDAVVVNRKRKEITVFSLRATPELQVCGVAKALLLGLWQSRMARHSGFSRSCCRQQLFRLVCLFRHAGS